MNIPQLPLIVTDRILHYFNQKYRWNHKLYWTYRLPLLAVSSTWRTLALKHVYSHAYIIIGHYKDYTNIEPIKSNGYTHHVTDLKIEMDNPSIITIFLEGYHKLFQFGTLNWSNVKRMDICLKSKFRSSHRLISEGYPTRSNKTYGEFIEAVITHMPNIVDLRIVCPSDSDEALMDNIVLIDNYQAQLEELALHTSVMFDSGLYFSNLVHLNVRFKSEDDVILPTVNPEMLKTLIMANVPLDFTWAYFQHNTEISGTVKFESLKVLKVSYSSKPTENIADGLEQELEISDFSIHFPVLEEISIANKIGMPTRDTRYTFPKHLKYLQIDSTFEGFQTLRNSGITMVDIAVINIKNVKVDNENVFLDLVNHFGNTGVTVSLFKLSADIKDYNLYFNGYRWANVRKLLVKECSASNFWSICRNCPNLRYFRVERLIVASNSCVNIDRMLGQTLEHLTVYIIRAEDTTQSIQTFVQTAMTCFAHLAYIRLDGCQWMDLERFIQANILEYPHLESLQITYKGSMSIGECPKHVGMVATLDKQ